MRRFCLALIAASLLIAGCGKPEDKFVGTYTGSLDLPQETIEEIKTLVTQFGQDPDEAINELQTMSMTLELRDDGVFTASNSSASGSNKTNGKWTLSEDGKSVTFSDMELTGDGESQAAIIGFDSNTTRTVQVSEDGNSLSFTEEQMDITMTVTFTRN